MDDRTQARVFDLHQRLQIMARDEGFSLRLFGAMTGTQQLVELGGDAYLLLFPETQSPLNLDAVRLLIAEPWRESSRPIFGRIIFSAERLLSSVRNNGGDLPENVAVVGLWGTQNQLSSKTVDNNIATILQAAGVPPFGGNESHDQQPTQDIPSATSRSLVRNKAVDCYKLERRLGHGRSAEVWKARVIREIDGVDLRVGGEVALKVYYLNFFRGGLDSIRVQREFAVASELVHPNVARVYDMVLSPSRPFHAFLAMEYVNGPTLKRFIEEKKKLDAQQTTEIGLQLFAALEEIHSHGALHRDVKAANIILSEDSRRLNIKLVDFGIVFVPAEENLTGASLFLGSKHSAPWEQLIGEGVDERSDIYAAGSVLFHCLQGAPMYNNAGPEGAIVHRMRSQPERLELSEPGRKTGPTALIAFVNECISVDSAARPASAAECLEKLRRIARNLR